MKRWDPAGLISALPNTWRAILSHPLAAKRLMLTAHQGLVLWIGVLWTLLLLVSYYRLWQNLSHDLSARILSNPNHRPRAWAACLPMLAVLMLAPGWFGALALLSIPALALSKGSSRLPITLVMIAAVVLLTPWWFPVRNAMPSIDPGSETSLLRAAIHEAPSAERITMLRNILQSGPTPERRTRLQLALATQLSRQGHYSNANEILDRILHRDNEHVAAIVGKGNNTYYLGRLDEAIDLYERALLLSPDEGEIPYNLAQAYFKKLFLPEAGQMLERARESGCNPPPWENTETDSDGYSPVLYLSLTRAEINASCRDESDTYVNLAHLSTWTDSLCPVPVPLFALPALALAIGTLLALWRERDATPSECANCGFSICGDCGHIQDDLWLCTTCNRTVENARSDIVRATLLKNRSRAQQLPRLAGLCRFGRVLPGGGHLAAGHIRAGMMRLTFLALGITLAAFGWAFSLSAEWASPGLILAEETVHPLWAPLPVAAWQGWNNWPLLLGGALVVILYMIALADGVSLRRKLPLRFTGQTDTDSSNYGALAGDN